ncbi:abscisic acid receptor PYL11-like [Andrographis paniculata]|uniref:abscisic acid receptor PYL11-like n=1 Tax=Andrographis paniculata TaxID=175694 RepID=UPI0021E97FEA|nr:abscisic acid receptor PYL11-like [Andrographis paniculata]
MAIAPSLDPKPNQCSSTLVQNIDAPTELVWSILRRFDRPEAYKKIVRKCTMLAGSGGVGSVREVALVSGLPGKVGRERLDRLDDDMRVMVYTIIGGDQRLENYQSTTTVHEDGGGTVVEESYVVDVPEGNNEEETRVFVNTVLRCNLRSLASVTENLAKCNN